MMSANNIKNVNHNREQEQDKTNVEVKCVEFQPPVDIEETKDEYILNVDMPGVDPNAIDVNLDKDILSIGAKAEIDGLPTRCYRRQFRVMRGLYPAKCKADYKLGVLTLRLAKPSSQIPHQIKISCE